MVWLRVPPVSIKCGYWIADHEIIFWYSTGATAVNQDYLHAILPVVYLTQGVPLFLFLKPEGEMQIFWGWGVYYNKYEQLTDACLQCLGYSPSGRYVVYIQSWPNSEKFAWPWLSAGFPISVKSSYTLKAIQVCQEKDSTFCLKISHTDGKIRPRSFIICSRCTDRSP